MSAAAIARWLRGLLLGLLWLGCMLPVGAAGASAAADWALKAGQIEAWERRDFQGSTRYVADVVDGETVLRADSDAAASGLYLTRAVDLSRTPRLHWRWRIQDALGNSGEKTREGDDFVARIYVVATHPAMFWRSRAICYVWASSATRGESWHNPYADGVKMVALRSGSDPSVRWMAESRDVAADFKRLFGAVPARIDGIAIMTDTDNTGASATAWYDGLRWSGQTLP